MIATLQKSTPLDLFIGNERIADISIQMMRGHRALRDSQAPSPEGSEDDEARSPVSTDGEGLTFMLTSPAAFGRGRKGNKSPAADKSDAANEESKRDALDVMH